MSVRYGISFERYGAIKAVNWSTLKRMADSPAHYRYATAHKRPDSSAMAVGRYVHEVVLEPDANTFAVFEGKRDQRSKAYQDFLVEHPGRTVLNVAESEVGLRMAFAVRNHRAARLALDRRWGKSEVTLTWTDEATGLKCKCRLDRLTRESIIDLKTTGSVNPRIFGALAYRMGYVEQHAFYGMGAAANGIMRVPQIIAVESEPPWDVAVLGIDDDSLYMAERKVRKLLDRVADCKRARRWPGRYPDEDLLLLPAYAYNDSDEALLEG